MLRGMRNIVKQFYWNHINNDHRVSIQHVPVSRLHSARIQPVDEGVDVQSGPDPQTKQPQKPQWTLPSRHQKSLAHTFTGGPRGKNDSEAPHINDISRPLNVSMSYFTETVTLFVV